MNGNQEVVPAIPQAVRGKTFGPSDIKWVKTVNDKTTNSAYLPPDNPYRRVITTPDGVFFCLQLNPDLTPSLNHVPLGDLILLHQRLDKQSVRCFTHLVTPIGNTVVSSPYGPLSPWPGRWVQVIAMTGNQAGKSINFQSTKWQTAGFTPAFHNLTFQQGRVWKIQPKISVQNLSNVQQDIWSRFRQWLI
jgi:hypothetical protein